MENSLIRCALFLYINFWVGVLSALADSLHDIFFFISATISSAQVWGWTCMLMACGEHMIMEFFVGQSAARKGNISL